MKLLLISSVEYFRIILSTKRPGPEFMTILDVHKISLYTAATVARAVGLSRAKDDLGCKLKNIFPMHCIFHITGSYP